MTSVALAIIHTEPPEVLAATDLDTLHAVLGLELIARLQPGELGADAAAHLRELLLAELWADALIAYMDATGDVVDVYAEYDVSDPTDVARELLAQELQLRPLFDAE